MGRRDYRKTSSKYLDSSVGGAVKEMVCANNRFANGDAWGRRGKRGGKIGREDSSLPTMLLFYNYARGVAKTVSIKEIGFNLSARGYQVLLLDLTGQANLSLLFDAYCRDGLSDRISDVLLMDVDGRRKKLSDIIIPTRWPNLDIAPSDISLVDAGYKMILQADGAADDILLHSIRDLLETRRYDFILIDCGSEPDVIFRNAVSALRAGNRRSLVLIPSFPDGRALTLMNRTLEFIDRACLDSGQSEARKIVLWTQANETIKVHRMVWERFKEMFPEVPTFRTSISSSVRVTEAINAHEPLSICAGNSKPAQCYELLADEILALVQDAILPGEIYMCRDNEGTRLMGVKLLGESDAFLPVWG